MTFFWYSTSSRTCGSSAVSKRCPKQTNPAPLTARRSYAQMAATLCTPSLLTISITYSWPSRYSCTSTALFTRPNPLILPMILPKAAWTSCRLRQRVTSSDPALSTGLTITLKGEGFHSSMNVAISPQVVARSCFTARRPAERMVSPITNLFLRASLWAVPFVRRPMASDKASASSTPVSAPANTPTIGIFKALIWSITDCNATLGSASVSREIVASNLTSSPSGIIFNRSFRSADRTQITL